MRSDGNRDSDDDSILELSDDLGELSLESSDETGLSTKSNLVGSLSLGADREERKEMSALNSKKGRRG